MKGRSIREFTFTAVGEFDVRGLLHSAEGIEEFDAVGAELPGEGDADAEADDRADGDVGGEFTGRVLEGFAVVLVQTARGLQSAACLGILCNYRTLCAWERKEKGDVIQAES